MSVMQVATRFRSTMNILGKLNEKRKTKYQTRIRGAEQHIKGYAG